MLFKELGTLSIKYTDSEYVVEWLKPPPPPQKFITNRSKAVVLMWSLLAVLVSEFR